MFSDRCEMAYGEQAALIGLCETVRPRVAVEIGTYQGGSLALLAPRCGLVHTLDLTSHVSEMLPNVEYHLGSSDVELPRVLLELERDGTNVDLVLVDGDHSREGVRRDVENLLASPAVERTVIVFHDAANEAVRAGIRDGIRGCNDLAYVNLSLIPPWERTRVLEEVWGGLGVAVVDRCGDFWLHRRRTDENVSWPTAVNQGPVWNAARPIRAARRRAGYALRPAVRRMRGVRGTRRGDSDHR